MVFEQDLAAGRRVTWRRSERTATAEIDLGRPVDAAIVRLEEPIERGQAVARYSVMGSADGSDWRLLSRGTTIGYARLDRFEPAKIRHVRVAIDEAVAAPEAIRVRVYAPRI
jgi:alpha-L-fucosidase